MLQYIYIYRRVNLYTILFIHSPVRCARAQLYTPRLRGGHDILGFLSAAFDLAAAPQHQHHTYTFRPR